MFPIKNVEDLQKLNELISLKNHVNEVRLQDKLGEQNHHKDAKKYINHLLIQLKIRLKI